MLLPTKAIMAAAGSKTNTTFPPASSTVPAGQAHQLPLPLVSNKSTPGVGAASPSIQPTIPTTSEQTTSTLRQPSSISVCKPSRLQKPYSRLPQVSSRLPLASALRRTIPSDSTGSHPTNAHAVYSRPQASASSSVVCFVPVFFG
jgi:hypothetical protein